MGGDASAYRPGATRAARLVREWADIVLAARGHPSVVVWVPVDESWGVPDLERDPRQRDLLRALAGIAGVLGGTRPVSVNDGWETAAGDLVGVHDYHQDPSALAARWRAGSDVDRALRGRRRDGRLADLDRAGTAGRPVLLSELDGVSLDAADKQTEGALAVSQATTAWGHGNASSSAELADRGQALWAAVPEAPLEQLAAAVRGEGA